MCDYDFEQSRSQHADNSLILNTEVLLNEKVPILG